MSSNHEKRKPLKNLLGLGSIFIISTSCLSPTFVTEQDKAEIIKQTLEKALIDKILPSAQFIETDGEIILSNQNIDSAWVPQLPNIKLAILKPEEILEKATHVEHRFHYLRFSELQILNSGRVKVSLDNTPIFGKDLLEKNYQDGWICVGGFTIEYRKKSGSWIADNEMHIHYRLTSIRELSERR